MHKKPNSDRKLSGKISISSKGTGYVELEGHKDDIEVDFKDLNTALHGDIVEVFLAGKNRGRQTGKVTKIVERLKTGFAGVLEQEKGVFFILPDDTRMYTDILVPKGALSGAKAGEKVFAEITSWNDPSKAPEGKITKILGKPGENTAEMHAIALEKGFEAELPSKVEEEAKRISALGGPALGGKHSYPDRRDFRKILTFTIDPYDAKDFDDAISFREVGKGDYEVGIHIADVSHYVKEGSDIDKEAKSRGTSVYLVDRTIPMLPEILSNDLCSLVPNQDRLTMSAVFVMDKNAVVKGEWFGKTVIHSQKRFTYEEAEESIKKVPTQGRDSDPKASELHKALVILNNMAKKLTKERFAQGAISLDQEEVKFVLDSDGVPIKVIKKERGDSNRLIEEFMLLANRKVAELIAKKNKKGEKESNIFVYRIHDLPSKEKMVDLHHFLRGLGHKINLKNGIIPNNELNALLEKMAEGGIDTVHRAVIRSMAKAIYSTKNIGHYGLAFKYYTHFTSPIRRYPDVIVHRMLMDYLNGRKIGSEKLKMYEEIARKASDQERRASDAERASIKYKQVEYMSKRIGEEFRGIISGITEWGMYVEETGTKCEGMVRVRDMKDDFYIFNEKNLELVGQGRKSRRPEGSGSRPQASGKKRYRLGDKVKIKVAGADLERKAIDYVLA